VLVRRALAAPDAAAELFCHTGGGCS
jgi:hypothetical protein